VEPLAAGRLRPFDRTQHDGRSDALSLAIAPCLRVEEEGVVTAIPGDVDEAKERVVPSAGCDPAEAVLTDLIPPPPDRTTAVRPHEIDHLSIADVATPLIGDLVCHLSSVLTSR
jgi:hypothetical protein